MGNLFSVGHSKHELSFFLALLNEYKVNYLIDVRSYPYSKYASSYNRDNLKSFLLNNNINYSFMGKYFGARPDDKNLYTPEGYLDFEKMAKSNLFNIGFESIKRGLAQDNNIALMCTEKEPIDCHRAILVTRAFALKNIQSTHILPDGTSILQSELDKQLLDIYFPNRTQISFFEEDNKTESDMIIDAYRQRNKIIGYKHKEE